MGAGPAGGQRDPVPAPAHRTGDGRLRDHGDEVAQWPGACAHTWRLRPLRPERARARGDRGREADRHPVRPEEARGDRPAGGAHRGHRGSGRRLQCRPGPVVQRHAGLHDGRHTRLPAGGLGEPRGRSHLSGSGVGPPGRDRVGEPVPEWQGAGRRPVTGRPARHLGQTVARRALLAHHLRRHFECSSLLVAGRARGALHPRSCRLRGGAGLRAPRRRHRDRALAALVHARLRADRAVARRPMAGAANCLGEQRNPRAQGRRHHAGSAGRLASHGTIPRALPRRTLAGLRLHRIGGDGGLRPAIPRDRVGQMAGVHRWRC